MNKIKIARMFHLILNKELNSPRYFNYFFFRLPDTGRRISLWQADLFRFQREHIQAQSWWCSLVSCRLISPWQQSTTVNRFYFSFVWIIVPGCKCLQQCLQLLASTWQSGYINQHIKIIVRPLNTLVNTGQLQNNTFNKNI